MDGIVVTAHCSLLMVLEGLSLGSQLKARDIIYKYYKVFAL